MKSKVHFFTDFEIIEILKHGSSSNCDKAIQFIYDKNFSLVKSYVLKNKGTDEDASDIFQESIVIMYQQIISNKFKAKSTLSTYLFGIAKNLWFTSIRKKSKFQTTTLDFEKKKDEVISEAVDNFNQEYNLFKTVFNELSVDCKKILQYVYFDDLTMKDILAKFDNLKNEQSVRTKKFRCMNYLVDLIEKKGLKKQDFIL